MHIIAKETREEERETVGLSLISFVWTEIQKFGAFKA